MTDCIFTTQKELKLYAKNSLENLTERFAHSSSGLLLLWYYLCHIRPDNRRPSPQPLVEPPEYYLSSILLTDFPSLVIRKGIKKSTNRIYISTNKNDEEKEEIYANPLKRLFYP